MMAAGQRLELGNLCFEMLWVGFEEQSDGVSYYWLLPAHGGR